MMVNLRLRGLRVVELGVLATLGLAGLPHLASADPGPTARVVAAEPELNYIYFQDDDRTSMSGDSRDIARAQRFRQGKETLLWFRDGGQEYVVRDPAVLKQVDATWRPVRELGEAQGKLGSQMGELGRQQGAYGAQQGVLGTRQGALAIREAALDMRSSHEQLTPAETAAIDHQRSELRKQQKALGKEMRAFKKPMRELDEQMGTLSREMDGLSQKMDLASHKARADMRSAIRQAIANGTAKPAK
jgi:hypothetical protein